VGYVVLGYQLGRFLGEEAWYIRAEGSGLYARRGGEGVHITFRFWEKAIQFRLLMSLIRTQYHLLILKFFQEY